MAFSKCWATPRTRPWPLDSSDAFARFFDKTHGPGSANQHWEAYASCAALLAGFQRADLCGDWAVTWPDRDRDRRVRAPRKCFP